MAHLPAAKEIVKAPLAVHNVAIATAKGDVDEGASGKGAPKFKFQKNFCPSEEIKFPDGTSFTFRLIELNTGGYSPMSRMETVDEKLANNLREAAKNPCSGIQELK